MASVFIIKLKCVQQDMWHHIFYQCFMYMQSVKLNAFTHKCARSCSTGMLTPHTPTALAVSYTQSTSSCLISLYRL